MPDSSNVLSPHFPVMVAQEALMVLRSNLFLAKRIRRDYEKEVKSYGQTVDIPKYGTLAANDKVPGASRTNQDLTSVKVSVTLNKHKEATFTIDDVQKAFSRNDLLQGYVNSGMTAILEAVEADIFALYAGLSVTRGVAGTDISDTLAKTIRTDIVNGKAPKDENWTMALDPKDYTALLGVDRFTTAEKIGKAGVLADGALGKIYNFHVFESQLAPVTGSGPASTHGLAFHKDFAALVVRDLPDIPSNLGVVSSVVSDPESGLSVRVRMNYDSETGGIATTVEILYGIAECRDELAVHVLT